MCWPNKLAAMNVSLREQERVGRCGKGETLDRPDIPHDVEHDSADPESGVVARVFRSLGAYPRPSGCKKLKEARSGSRRIRVGA